MHRKHTTGFPEMLFHHHDVPESVETVLHIYTEERTRSVRAYVICERHCIWLNPDRIAKIPHENNDSVSVCIRVR